MSYTNRTEWNQGLSPGGPIFSGQKKQRKLKKKKKEIKSSKTDRKNPNRKIIVFLKTKERKMS